MFWAEKSPTSQKANPLDLDVKFIKFHIQIAIQVFCVVLSVDFEVPSTHATTQMFFHLTASTTTRTSVHFSLGNSIFTLHACMTSVPTKLQQARKNGTAQMRDFWNVDHVAAVQLWDGGHYSSSSLTHSLLTMRKHDMSGSKHLMWNVKSLNFYNEEAGFASKCAVLKGYLSAWNLFSFPLQDFVCKFETGKFMGWGSERVKNGKHS